MVNDRSDYFGLELNDKFNLRELFGKRIDFKDKERLYRFHIRNFQKKLNNMFEYENLPETITNRYLELLIQVNGFAIIFQKDEKTYCSFGGLGGKPNHEYMPTLATIANPFLGISGKWAIDWGYGIDSKLNGEKIEGECVVIPNDSLFMGTIPVNSYYATQLIENDLTMNCNLINLRVMNLIYAKDEDVKKSLDEVIEDLENGKIKSALDENFFEDGIKSTPFGSNGSANNIVQLLEQRQYIKGSWWNEWGVQSNYNMKRESITSSENILNVDNLIPLTDSMKDFREKSWELANKKFGLSVKVDFSSAWKKLKKELNLKEEKLENEAKGMNSLSNQLDKENKEGNGDNNEKT